MRALAAGGAEAVRVEALAKALGVTKGGFYGYFADRDARDKVRLAGRLTFSSDRLLPIDLAIRDWARRDHTVAERLRRVDNKRIQLARDAISTFCDDPDEVEARALLAFCMAIGSHFLAADHPGSNRSPVIARAADIILDLPRGNPGG
ncbi:helix-turn-helix domain-containing protein [Streptomyces nojiriensis]|uniref:helix-turn-helix domain-containing protein n=1 Tax=Streptomyces nojiriensis TaxID=66374 RepID=UPI003655D972